MSPSGVRQRPKLTGCPCTGETLDRLIQPAILVVLADEPMHGYRLVQRIGTLPGFAGAKPDASGVYRLLKAMQRRGLVRFTWGLSESGPARRLYQITPAGRDCLARWSTTLEAYLETITALLKETQAAKAGKPNRRKTRPQRIAKSVE